MDLNNVPAKVRLVGFCLFCWLTFAIAISFDYSGFYWSRFFGIGVFPIMFIFGLIWTLKGFLKGRPLVRIKNETAQPLKHSEPAGPTNDTVMNSNRLPYIVVDPLAIKSQVKTSTTSIGKVIFAVLVAMICGAIGKASVRSVLSPSTEKIERAIADKLQTAADALTKEGPVMIDEITRREKVTAMGKEITYHLSFPSLTSEEVDIAVMSAAIRKITEKNVCENKLMRPAMIHGVTYRYRYLTSDNVQVSNFSISQKTCLSLQASAPNHQSD